MRYHVAPVVFAVVSLSIAGGVGSRIAPDAARAFAAQNASWTPPLLADGHPDLQGVWLNNSATPLERPKALEHRTSLTDAEVRELQQRAARLLADPNNDFAAGDSLFLAALDNVARYKNPNGTGNATDMIEREFENRTSLIVEPPDGRIPWTVEGKRRNDVAAATRRTTTPAGPEDLSLETRCITYGIPRVGVQNVNSAGPLGYYELVQSPGYVVLLYEAIHEARIIPIDDRPRLPDAIWQWTGESRGRWDGNTLVVDTTHFSPKANVMGSADHLHLVERFTRVAADRIVYTMTFDDPTTWSRPWTMEIRLKQSRDRIYEYACHEGSLVLIQDLLAAARAEEKAAEAARKPRR